MTKEPFTPHPVDIFVGKKLRQQRTMLGMSQEELGKSVGVTFQQVQKYERGFNRIGCSRIYEFSRVLGVGVAYFFDGISCETQEKELVENKSAFEGADEYNINNKEVLTLVRAYHEVTDLNVRKKVLSLVKSLT